MIVDFCYLASSYFSLLDDSKLSSSEVDTEGEDLTFLDFGDDFTEDSEGGMFK